MPKCLRIGTPASAPLTPVLERVPGLRLVSSSRAATRTVSAPSLKGQCAVMGAARVRRGRPSAVPCLESAPICSPAPLIVGDVGGAARSVRRVMTDPAADAAAPGGGPRRRPVGGLSRRTLRLLRPNFAWARASGHPVHRHSDGAHPRMSSGRSVHVHSGERVCSERAMVSSGGRVLPAGAWLRRE